MAPRNTVSFRLDGEDLAVLRKVGALSGVSADMVCRKLVVDLIPQLQRVLAAAESLYEEHDPAGRGYMTWFIHIPEPGVVDSEESGVSMQPTGALVMLQVGDRHVIEGELLELRRPERKGYGQFFFAVPRSGPGIFRHYGESAETDAAADSDVAVPGGER